MIVKTLKGKYLLRIIKCCDNCIVRGYEFYCPIQDKHIAGWMRCDKWQETNLPLYEYVNRGHE